MKRIAVIVLVNVLLISALALPVRARDAAIICLDPGHGGTDPGAVHQFADGRVLKEEDINLDVAFALQKLLEQSGYRVTLTRTDSTFLTTNSRYPMANTAQADLFVSIHTNSITADKAGDIDGALTLYSKADDIPFAEALESVLYPAMLARAPNPAIFLDRGTRPFRSRLMSRTVMPAVIVEPVFLSYPDEAARLLSPIRYDGAGRALADTRRGEIAVALHKGILGYLQTHGVAAVSSGPLSPTVVPSQTTAPTVAPSPSQTPTIVPSPSPTPTAALSPSPTPAATPTEWATPVWAWWIWPSPGGYPW